VPAQRTVIEKVHDAYPKAWFTIIQLNILMMKLIARSSNASLREVTRYEDSKSIIIVGSASVSSDTATVNAETIKPTQRVHKNEHKMITFLGRRIKHQIF
jgi:hypothetical protein